MNKQIENESLDLSIRRLKSSLPSALIQPLMTKNKHSNPNMSSQNNKGCNPVCIRVRSKYEIWGLHGEYLDCGLRDGYWRFYPEDEGSTHLWNVTNHPEEYTRHHNPDEDHNIN